MALHQTLSTRITDCALSVQCLASVNDPGLCPIYHCSTHTPTRLTVLNVLIVHILPWKLLVATLAMKTLSEVNSYNVAVDRVFEHHFGTPVPQTLGCAVRMPLGGMPFTGVSADAGSGADDPHLAGVAGRSPSTFMDADHTATVACTGGEIIFVDPQPFNVDGIGTLGTSVTCTLLFRRPVDHDWGLPLVIGEVCSVFGGAEGGG